MTIIILKIRESYENFQNSVDSSMVNEVLEFQKGNNQNLEIHNSFAKFKLNMVLLHVKLIFGKNYQGKVECSEEGYFCSS